jgi:hypothetical protein
MQLKLKPLLKELTNTLLLNLYWFLGQYKYPLEIIPKKGYLRTIDFQTFPKDLNLVLIRRSNCLTQLETFTKLGTLKEQAILKDQLPGMSLFLLGGFFKIEDIYFRQIKNGDLDWSGEKIFFCDLKKDYEKLNSAIPIYFNFKDIDEISFPYAKVGDEAKKISKSLGLQTTPTDGKYKFNGTSSIKHVPVNLNYWHVELVLLDITKKPIKDLRKDWSTSAVSQALGQIVSVAFEATPTIQKIPAKHFYN